MDEVLVYASCAFCGENADEVWAKETNFTVVRCRCRFLYLNPRPAPNVIDAAVRSGIHVEAGGVNVQARPIPRKTALYKHRVQRLFADMIEKGRAVVWLDVGCGYGEVLEAVAGILPDGSQTCGVEPMAVKAAYARQKGISVVEGYLSKDHPKVDVISAIDIFSHIPNFDQVLETMNFVLRDNGELFIETGNLADLNSREEFSGDLGLPDHVNFAGESHICKMIERNGFKIVKIERIPSDNIFYTIKNIVKKMIGRNVKLALPYRSKYRTLLIRARKVSA